MTAKDASAWNTVVFDKVSTSTTNSKTFTHEGTSWKVTMFTRMSYSFLINHSYISSCISLSSSIDIKASYSIKLVNPEHEEISKRLGPSIRSFTAGTGIEWQEITRADLLDPVNGFLLNDTTTIQVQIKILREIKVNRADYSLSNEMHTLLFDETTSDFTIVCKRAMNESRLIEKQSIDEVEVHENESIPVHKMILQVRSPVFKAMLSSAMKESTSNEIIITEFDHDVVKKFIRFLYLDTCDRGALEAKSLLAMAHKYEVKGLFLACELDLIKMFSVSNVVDLLTFADLYEAKELKNKALTFIKDNLKVLAESGRFCESLSPELVHEVICQLINL